MKTPWPYPSGRASVRLYFASNLLFVTGSVLFFPAFSSLADVSLLCFMLGLLTYIYTGLIPLQTAAAEHHHASVPEIFAAFGPILFFLGCVLCLSVIGLYIAGGVCYSLGCGTWALSSWSGYLRERKNGSAVIELISTAGCLFFTILSVYFVWYLAAGRNVTLDGILVAGGYLTGSCLFVLTDLIGTARRKKVYSLQQ